MVNPGWLQQQSELRWFHKLQGDLPTMLSRATANGQNPCTKYFAYQPSSVPHQSSDHVLQEASSWHCHERGRKAAAGWKEVGAAAGVDKHQHQMPSEMGGRYRGCSQGVLQRKVPLCLFRLSTSSIIHVPSELQDFLLTCMDEALARSSA